MSNKVKTIRIDDNSEVGKWATNQNNFSQSAIQAIKYVISRYGTGDLFDSMMREVIEGKTEPVRMAPVSHTSEYKEHKEHKEIVESPIEDSSESNSAESSNKSSNEDLVEKEPKEQLTHASGLKAKIQKKEESTNNSGKRKTRKKINLNMLSD